MLIKQVETNLLDRNAINIEFLYGQLRKLRDKQVDFADFYLQLTTSESFALDEGIIKSASFSINDGIGIRAVCYDKTFLTYSNNISEKSIKGLVDGIFVEKSDIRAKFKSNYSLLDKSHYTFSNPVLDVSQQEKIKILQKIDQIARNLPHVTNVIASLSIEYDEIAILNTMDLLTSDIRPLIHLSISIIINKNNFTEKGNSGFGGRSTLLSTCTDEAIQSHIQKAYDQAILKVEATTCPNGEMPVVLGNGWAGVILHEAVGHGLESDFNRKGSSAFSNRIGEQVASKLVTVVDDGTLANRRGSLNIDDEGNPTQKTVLIENGILQGYMFDELNAMLMGKKSTGNGRRESFAANPMPRMTNTYMLNGEYSHDEIIRSVKNGIYAESFDGGQVDITSGQFVFNASLAWVIRDGKLAYPVKGCALVGNGPECLKHVTMVGNNLELDSGIGVCGKNGQSVPVGVGQPTIKVEKSLVVGGA